MAWSLSGQGARTDLSSDAHVSTQAHGHTHYTMAYHPGRLIFSVEQKRAMSWIILKLVSLHAPITLSSAAAAAAKSLQSCRTLCDPIDGSPPGSPVPGILQARTLEWVAISFSNA